MGLFVAPVPSPFLDDFDGLKLYDDYMSVRYEGGQPWNFVYIRPGTVNLSATRFWRDYSGFDRIRLVLRRDGPCEEMVVVLKDTTDADDGSQATVAPELSDEWQTFEYDLSDFSDADLSHLNVITGFAFMDKPCALSIRDVEFLRPGET